MSAVSFSNSPHHDTPLSVLVYFQPRPEKIKKYRRHTPQSPLEAFFGSYYPQFEYDATESASHEFYRLCDEFGWDRDDSEREDAHREFKNALVNNLTKSMERTKRILQGGKTYVTSWTLIRSRTIWRHAICATHVNLVDLVDRDVTGQDVQVFRSERKLSEYTRMTGKYFPKENALYPPQDQPTSLNGDFIPARVFLSRSETELHV
ncbi:hypothetical protein EV363DRAFT_1437419 [Boletus edulis]|nr:hypothetical protein EV363DRAFT_1437419 [Boletus edulis]